MGASDAAAGVPPLRRGWLQTEKPPNKYLPTVLVIPASRTATNYRLAPPLVNEQQSNTGTNLSHSGWLLSGLSDTSDRSDLPTN